MTEICDWCSTSFGEREISDAEVIRNYQGSVLFKLSGRLHQITVRKPYRGDRNGTAQEILDGQGNESESESAVDGRL
jgi:hypothetical protein